MSQTRAAISGFGFNEIAEPPKNLCIGNVFQREDGTWAWTVHGESPTMLEADTRMRAAMEGGTIINGPKNATVNPDKLLATAAEEIESAADAVGPDFDGARTEGGTPAQTVMFGISSMTPTPKAIGFFVRQVQGQVRAKSGVFRWRERPRILFAGDKRSIVARFAVEPDDGETYEQPVEQTASPLG